MSSSKVIDFRVSLPEEDASVDVAFKRAIRRCLDENYEAVQVKGLVESFLMWKYRDHWREMCDEPVDGE